MNLVKSLLEVLQKIDVLSVLLIICVKFLLPVITRNIIFIAFMKVFKIPFQEAVDASIRITTFGKDK